MSQPNRNNRIRETNQERENRSQRKGPVGPIQKRIQSILDSSSPQTSQRMGETRVMPENSDMQPSNSSQKRVDVFQDSQRIVASHVYSQSLPHSRSITETRVMPSRADRRTPLSHQERQRAISQSKFFKSETDIGFAERQIRFECLQGPEQQAQEQWAQYQLSLNFGLCLMSYEWIRIKGGYRCRGGYHMVSDELLAEGKGRYYILETVSPFQRKLMDSFFQAIHQQFMKTSIMPNQGSRHDRANRMLSGTGGFQTQGLHPSMLQNASNHLRQDNPPYWAVCPRGECIWLGPWGPDPRAMIRGGQYFQRKLNGQWGKNILQNRHDQYMAMRQLLVDVLSPSERKEQENWARVQLKMNSSKGNSWIRVQEGISGYISGDQRFKVTDELLAEGLGGFYILTRSSPLDFLIADGPHYRLSSSGKTIEQLLTELEMYEPVPGGNISQGQKFDMNRYSRGMGR